MKINSPESRLVFYTLLVDIIIFAILCIFFFFNLPGVPLGFLAGSLISFINHYLMKLQIDVMIKDDGTTGNPLIFTLVYFLRFAIYGGGLFLAFYLDYLGYPYLMWYTMFPAFLVFKIVIYLKFKDKTKSKYIKKTKLNDFSSFDKKSED